MPRGKRGRSGFGFAGQLSKMVNKLKEQRQKHADALRSIDNIFESIGITTHLAGDAASPGRGRKPGRPPGKRGPGRPRKGHPMTTTRGRRKRRTFATSGTESVLTFVKAGGGKGRASSEINKNWKSEGRSGDAYITLGQLVKAKKLKKQKLDGERGSRYTTA